MDTAKREVDPEFQLLEMREVSFELSPAELQSVAAFLEDCAERMHHGDFRTDHLHMPKAPLGVDLIVINPGSSHLDVQ